LSVLNFFRIGSLERWIIAPRRLIAPTSALFLSAARQEGIADAWESSSLAGYSSALSLYTAFRKDAKAAVDLTYQLTIENFIISMAQSYPHGTVRHYLSGLRHHVAQLGQLLLRGIRKRSAQRNPITRRAPAQIPAIPLLVLVGGTRSKLSIAL
jgi:hypothetical protein